VILPLALEASTVLAFPVRAKLKNRIVIDEEIALVAVVCTRRSEKYGEENRRLY
jgi:hypothetical protein